MRVLTGMSQSHRQERGVQMRSIVLLTVLVLYGWQNLLLLLKVLFIRKGLCYNSVMLNGNSVPTK